MTIFTEAYLQDLERTVPVVSGKELVAILRAVQDAMDGAPGSGTITTLGDVPSGAAFDGTQGSILTSVSTGFTISVADTVLGSGGPITLVSGSAEQGAGGDIVLTTKWGTDFGQSGNIYLTTGDTVQATTGEIKLQTGNAAGGEPAGQESGPVTLMTGTPSGAAPAGHLVFGTNLVEVLRIDEDGTWLLAGDPGTAGYVLTTQGAGAPPIWVEAAAGSGTITAVGDVASGAAFDGTQGSELIAPSVFNIRTADVLVGNSGVISISSGETTDGNSGIVFVGSGVANGVGRSSGQVAISSGNTEDGDSGAVTIATAPGNGADRQAGAISITVGGSTGSADGSALYLTSGSADGTGAGGPVQIESGAGGGVSGNSGLVTIRSADTTTESSVSGVVEIRTGTASAGDSGDVTISTGNTGGDGVAGNVLLKAGDSDAENAGSVTITAGTAISGESGRITLTGGGTSGSGGNIVLFGAEGVTGGNVIVDSGPGLTAGAASGSVEILTSGTSDGDTGGIAVTTSNASGTDRSTGDISLLTGLPTGTGVRGGISLDSREVTITGASVVQNSQSGDYTTVAADANKHIFHPDTDDNPRTFTIDSNANVPYEVGTALTFVNEINTLTISITDDTLTQALTEAVGDRTLVGYDMATALKVAPTKWIIS